MARLVESSWPDGRVDALGDDIFLALGEHKIAKPLIEPELVPHVRFPATISRPSRATLIFSAHGTEPLYPRRDSGLLAPVSFALAFTKALTPALRRAHSFLGRTCSHHAFTRSSNRFAHTYS